MEVVVGEGVGLHYQNILYALMKFSNNKNIKKGNSSPSQQIIGC